MSKVLITSISKKVPLIKAVQKAAKSLSEPLIVVGADNDSNCVGRYFVDQFWKIPLTKDLSIAALIDYCLQESITSIIPTRDGELLFFATHFKSLQKEGIEVMVSSIQGIELANDKYQFSKDFTDAIPTEKELSSLDAKAYVVKERYGAGSHSIGLQLSKEEALTHAHLIKDPVYQPYIKGKEFSVDLFITKTGSCHGIVCRERVVVANGESQVTRTVKNSEMEKRCIELAQHMNLYGHVMFQFLLDKETKQMYLLECNPRFGGASTASIQAGLDSFRWFLLESKGLSLYPFKYANQDVLMVRHAEDSFFDA